MEGEKEGKVDSKISVDKASPDAARSGNPRDDNSWKDVVRKVSCSAKHLEVTEGRCCGRGHCLRGGVPFCYDITKG